MRADQTVDAAIVEATTLRENRLFFLHIASKHPEIQLLKTLRERGVL